MQDQMAAGDMNFKFMEIIEQVIRSLHFQIKRKKKQKLDNDKSCTSEGLLPFQTLTQG